MYIIPIRVSKNIIKITNVPASAEDKSLTIALNPASGRQVHVAENYEHGERCEYDLQTSNKKNNTYYLICLQILLREIES